MPDPKADNYLEALDQKAEFLIETLEQFIDITKLQQDFYKQSIINAKAVGLELPADFSYSIKESWQLIICHLAVRWAIKHRIRPDALHSAFQSSMNALYTLDINDKLNRIYPDDSESTGQDCSNFGGSSSNSNYKSQKRTQGEPSDDDLLS